VETVVLLSRKLLDSHINVKIEFRASLRVYIEAIRKGDMDVEKINDLMNHLEVLKAQKRIFEESA